MITLDTLKNIQYVYIGELSNDQISCEWNTRKRIIQIESVDKFIPDIVYFIETMPIFRKQRNIEAFDRRVISYKRRKKG